MLIETLTAEEARVLGTLLEKSLATPDYYPMTLNALRTACNQKSSREPVTEYGEETVGQALAGLKRKCLVAFIPYGSAGAFKYRHFLEDARFNLGKPELAVLAVLLLRGAQTLNEVRTRAGSLHAPIAAPEDAEAALQGLASRPEPLAELLPKRPGWKEARWRDILRAHGEESLPASGTAQAAEMTELKELKELKEKAGTAQPGATAASGPDRDALEELRREVAELKEAYAALRTEVDRIRSELGG